MLHNITLAIALQIPVMQFRGKGIGILLLFYVLSAITAAIRLKSLIIDANNKSLVMLSLSRVMLSE